MLAAYSTTPVKATTPLRKINPLVGRRRTYWWHRRHRDQLHEIESRLWAVFAVYPDLSASRWAWAIVGHLFVHLTEEPRQRYEASPGDRHLSRAQVLRRLHDVMAPFHPDVLVLAEGPPWGRYGVSEDMPLGDFDAEFRELLLQGAIAREFNVLVDDSTLEAAATVGDLASAIAQELPYLTPQTPDSDWRSGGFDRYGA